MKSMKRGCLFSKPSPDKQGISEALTHLGIICPCHLIWCLVAWGEGRWTTIHISVWYISFLFWALHVVFIFFAMAATSEITTSLEVGRRNLFLDCFFDSDPIQIFNSLWAMEGEEFGTPKVFPVSFFISPVLLSIVVKGSGFCSVSHACWPNTPETDT